MFDQISGHPMAQSSWHKIHYHTIEVCMSTILELWVTEVLKQADWGSNLALRHVLLVSHPYAYVTSSDATSEELHSVYYLP